MTSPLQADTDEIADLARRAGAPVELVKERYEDEVIRLKAGATVEHYIAVTAGRRVEQKLRARRRAVG
jgi:Protein of unknown function (DUF3562)